MEVPATRPHSTIPSNAMLGLPAQVGCMGCVCVLGVRAGACLSAETSAVGQAATFLLSSLPLEIPRRFPLPEAFFSFVLAVTRSPSP